MLMTDIILVAVFATVVTLLLLALAILFLYRRKKRLRSSANHQEKSDPLIERLVSAAGGAKNIRTVSSRGARLSLTIEDPARVDLSGFQGGEISTLVMERKLTFVLGSEAAKMKEQIEERLG